MSPPLPFFKLKTEDIALRNSGAEPCASCGGEEIKARFPSSQESILEICQVARLVQVPWGERKSWVGSHKGPSHFCTELGCRGVTPGLQCPEMCPDLPPNQPGRRRERACSSRGKANPGPPERARGTWVAFGGHRSGVAVLEHPYRDVPSHGGCSVSGAPLTNHVSSPYLHDPCP